MLAPPCGDIECNRARPAMRPVPQQQPEMIQPAANPEANRSSLIFNAPIQYYARFLVDWASRIYGRDRNGN